MRTAANSVARWNGTESPRVFTAGTDGEAPEHRPHRNGVSELSSAVYELSQSNTDDSSVWPFTPAWVCSICEDAGFCVSSIGFNSAEYEIISITYNVSTGHVMNVLMQLSFIAIITRSSLCKCVLDHVSWSLAAQSATIQKQLDQLVAGLLLVHQENNYKASAGSYSGVLRCLMLTTETLQYDIYTVFHMFWVIVMKVILIIIIVHFICYALFLNPKCYSKTKTQKYNN